MIIVKVFNDSNNKLPKYETPQAAGLDLRADFSRVESISDIKIYGPGQIIPANSANAVKMIVLEPGSRVCIPTGLYIALPEGYEAQVRPRSGLALKEGITVLNTPGTIDADYRGNIGVILINQGLKTVYIEDGERIGQLVLNKVEQIGWEEVSSKDDLGFTKRGEGGFSSTGKR
ncbi:dUTP diphosphatase [uncultured Leptotrichia sp.]|uniref:dUTP diphosphatase n=1 Tax=uncultured Leptotrichia sp. TaxID=159271 RepID=UPI0025F96A85|nr:dUTP diphosphatase [uncultured Leptotrichia sp.]